MNEELLAVVNLELLSMGFLLVSRSNETWQYARDDLSVLVVARDDGGLGILTGPYADAHDSLTVLYEGRRPRKQLRRLLDAT